MKTNLDLNSPTSFHAKVAPRFVNSLRGFVNHGENRLKNNYRLTKKLEEYANFGYENYTIELHQKSGVLGSEYKLVAVKDGDSSENGIILNKQSFNSYRQMFNRFMSINKHDFIAIMKKGEKKS